MTPEIFIDRLRKSGPAPGYLFLGPEPYHRERSRRALIESALPLEDRENGFTYHDLDQVSLREAIDDARSFSLFASKRIVWLASAESAIPRSEPEIDDPSGIGAYLREPVPGTTLVVEASRYDFDGEDKAKLERVQKFYSAIPNQVEFRPFSPESARATAQMIAKEAGLHLGLAELAILLEATAGDVARIAVEIEKLKLFAGARKVTAADIAALVPDAQSTTIFALVSAIGQGDRTRALEILDTLTRAGEYMPLALTFLATQFRMALAAREANLRGAGQILSHFNQIGARIWPDRARQIEQTVQAFPKAKLERAVVKLFEADRSLRDARPDDRIVMEEMILELTGPGRSA